MRPIFYDTETTGLVIGKDRIIEIAAYDPTEDRSFVSFIQPGIPIPKEATAVHNITDEMVQDALPFTAVFAKFCDFCSGEVVLVAHNNDSFDAPFLRAECSLSQSIIPSWSFLDSLKWARKYRPDLPRHTLQFLREAYGIEANKAHRALDDCIVLAKVFAAMIDDLPLEVVFQLLATAPSKTTHMPFGKHQGKPLNEVPKDYIRWLALSGALDKAENQPLKMTLEKQGLLALS